MGKTWYILCLGGLRRTNPGRVGFDNPDYPVGLISTIGLDSTFDQTSWSRPVFCRPFGTLSMRKVLETNSSADRVILCVNIVWLGLFRQHSGSELGAPGYLSTHIHFVIHGHRLNY